MSASKLPLVRYDSVCRALAKAARVDEVKHIRDAAIAMQAYARQAKNREAEADAVAIRLRATRKLDQLVQAQRKTVGLATGGEHGGRRPKDGLRHNPSNARATLAMQGIDKALAHQARVLGRMSESDFERKVTDARRSAGNVYRRAVREAEIMQERAERRARTAAGGSVADLHTLIASGYRAGVIAADPAWPFTAYSDRSNSIVPYETMTLDEIKALPVGQLAAADCALFLWGIWPNLPMWMPVLEAWGFTFSGLGFDWVKLNPNGEGLHWGTGYGTRANPEPCLLARRGSPLRLDAGVHSVIMTPVGAHSEKPDEAYARMKRLFGGPYLELFARKERPGWTTWGNEIPRVAEAAE
jgi:N6-adenosine-specific RNA methylase IME4